MADDIKQTANLKDLDRDVRNAIDPGKHKQFNLHQIALMRMFEPLISAVEQIDARLSHIEAGFGITDKPKHAGRVTEERKDKGPPQVGG